VAMTVANLPIGSDASEKLPSLWERCDSAESDRIVTSPEPADPGDRHVAVYREPAPWPRIFPSL
jgi:hypothetical protein